MEKNKSINKKRIGTIVAIIVLGLSYFAVQQLFFKEPSFDKEIEHASIELNKECPMMVDPNTRLDNAEALPGRKIKYNYTLVELEKSEINLDTVTKYVEPGIVNNIKTNQEMALYRDNNTTFIYNYKDKNGLFVYEFTVTPEMYKE